VTAPSSSPAAAAKSALRAELLAARRAVPAPVRDEEARALADWMVGLSGTVCAYAPVGTEPGSVAMLDALVTAGCSVLLPVVVEGGPLDWAAYSGFGALVPARFGVLEPVGPRLGSAAVRAARSVLVPALAVDRHGVRLGRGGGHYDRTLALVSPGADLIAVVRDSELVESLPREPHDVLVTAALTPTAGFTPLPR
jgi:5-formyltetrahydrofolate cyclo-ligase